MKAAALCSADAPTACLPRFLLPSPQPAAGGCPPVAPRVLLVCGADVLHSMADPALWRQDLLEVCWLRRHSGARGERPARSPPPRSCAHGPPACPPGRRRPQALLSQHGVVCVTRAGAEAARLLDEPGSLLNRYRAHVAVVEEPVPNEISSSRVG